MDWCVRVPGRMVAVVGCLTNNQPADETHSNRKMLFTLITALFIPLTTRPTVAEKISRRGAGYAEKDCRCWSPDHTTCKSYDNTQSAIGTDNIALAYSIIQG